MAAAAPTPTPIAKVEPPKVVEAPKAAEPQTKSSLFSLSRARSGNYADIVVESSKSGVEAATEPIDPAAEQKLTEAQSAIVELIKGWRPRFISAFESMSVSGNCITIVAPAASLAAEIEQCRVEMLLKIRDIAGVRGLLKMEIKVDESLKSKKIVKLEDRVSHFGSNPMVIKLKEALDLAVDG